MTSSYNFKEQDVMIYVYDNKRNGLDIKSI